MGYTLVLKNRKAADDMLSVKMADVLTILQSGDKDGLWNLFNRVVSAANTIHDKEWLKMIVNWVPEGGLKLTDMARWMPLARRIDKLDETEQELILSQNTVNMLWDRLNDDNFKLNRMDAAFVGFISEFQEVTGKHFAVPEEEV